MHERAEHADADDHTDGCQRGRRGECRPHLRPARRESTLRDDQDECAETEMAGELGVVEVNTEPGFVDGQTEVEIDEQARQTEAGGQTHRDRTAQHDGRAQQDREIFRVRHARGAGPRSASSRWARSVGGSATATSLSRLASPARSTRSRRRRPRASATAVRAASVARPSTGGVATATTRARPYLPWWPPPTAVRAAPGLTRNGNVTTTHCDERPANVPPERAPRIGHHGDRGLTVAARTTSDLRCLAEQGRVRLA